MSRMCNCIQQQMLKWHKNGLKAQCRVHESVTVGLKTNVCPENVK
jgi:hypothetical protein